ncbi:MAG: hypothetical protein GF375_01370 [Candidatus Omnitrophica bacterium]|nr:hypothetical protein [Candidatus Omnitrophota bacterium]MBD3268781.1 hypothetical protein [Candidatus Omnitrophota bacterium]
MGQTVSEKILSRCSGSILEAGHKGSCNIDLCFSNDITTPLLIDKLGKKKLFYKKKYAIFLDHNTPAPNTAVAGTHSLLRKFAKKNNIRLFDVGKGISSQLIWENNLYRPGGIILGTDSYVNCFGAVGTAAGKATLQDIISVLREGKSRIVVPHTYRIVLKGRLSDKISAVDAALFLISKLKRYKIRDEAIEITGKVGDFSLSERMSMLSSFAQTGIKFLFSYPFCNRVSLNFKHSEIKNFLPDDDCKYKKTLEFNLSDIPPLLSRPHSILKVSPVKKEEGTKIDQAILGGGSSGRLNDLRIAAKILKDKRINPSVRFFIVPASYSIWQRALKEGLVRIFLNSGAVLLPPGYGPCEGDHQGIPADGEIVITTANNNSRGIMGNYKSKVYLSSKYTVIASAIKGEITNPLDFKHSRRSLTKGGR